MKAYCVYQLYDSISPEEVIDTIKIFSTKEEALKHKEKLDKNVIPDNMIWSVMPMLTYCSWPEEKDAEPKKPNVWKPLKPVNEYNGYTIEDYRKQEKLFDLATYGFKPAVIIERELC